MNNIKFKYYIEKRKGVFIHKIFTLHQIECGKACKWVMDNQANFQRKWWYHKDVIRCQFTNKVDKTGAEIFADDIVDWDEEHLGKREIVQWSEEESSWVCHNPEDCGSWLTGINEIATLIGNTHQNPELMLKEV